MDVFSLSFNKTLTKRGGGGALQGEAGDDERHGEGKAPPNLVQTQHGEREGAEVERSSHGHGERSVRHPHEQLVIDGRENCHANPPAERREQQL